MLSNLLSTDYFFTTRPSDIQAVFVSDLHLSADTPKLCQEFLRLIDDLKNLKNLNTLYLLGDWLDAWVGDDTYLSLSHQEQLTHWLSPVLSALKSLSDQGVQILVMHGNRDFTIRQTLCSIFGGALINEPYFINTVSYRIRLEHGDALCTDDTTYQHFRTIIRNPLISFLLLKLPKSLRIRLTNQIKQQSHKQKIAKTATIMDVNQNAIAQAFGSCDILLHGHTHRPAVHHFNSPSGHLKTRIVLGDWQENHQTIQAAIGLLMGDNLILAQRIQPK